jgi:hypothetical protein
MFVNFSVTNAKNISQGSVNILVNLQRNDLIIIPFGTQFVLSVK